MKTLETQFNNEQKYLEYIQVKGEWESMKQHKINRIIMRSKVQWVHKVKKTLKTFWILRKGTTTILTLKAN